MSRAHEAHTNLSLPTILAIGLLLFLGFTHASALAPPPPSTHAPHGVLAEGIDRAPETPRLAKTAAAGRIGSAALSVACALVVLDDHLGGGVEGPPVTHAAHLDGKDGDESSSWRLMESSWSHHGVIVESSWRHHGVIMEYHGVVMESSRSHDLDGEEDVGRLLHKLRLRDSAIAIDVEAAPRGVDVGAADSTCSLRLVQGKLGLLGRWR